MTYLVVRHARACSAVRSPPLAEDVGGRGGRLSLTANLSYKPSSPRDARPAHSGPAACRSIRAPLASGWRAGDAALSAQRRVPDGVRPRVTREVRSGCVAVSLAECLVLWFCVSLLCDRHRPSSVHPYRVGVPVVGRTVFRLPINQSIPTRGKRVGGGQTEKPRGMTSSEDVRRVRVWCLLAPSRGGAPLLGETWSAD